MVGREARTEDALHAFDELCREGNLGHQQQYIATGGQHLRNQVDIDLRLTRARHTMQQCRRAPCRKVGSQSRQRLLLMRSEGWQTERGRTIFGRGGMLRKGQDTLLDKRLQGCSLGRQQSACHLARRGALLTRSDLQQRLIEARSTSLQPIEELVELLLIASVRLGQGVVTLGAGVEGLLQQTALAIGRGLHQRGQRTTHHLAQRTHIIGSDPLPLLALMGINQGCIIDLAHQLLKLLYIRALVMHPPHDARIVLL